MAGTPRRRRLRRLGAALLLLLGALALLVALLPQLLQPRIERAASAALNTPVRIGWLDVGEALAGRLVVREVSIGEGGALSIARVTAQADPAALLERRIVLERVEIDGLRGTVEQDAEGRPALRGLPFPEQDAAASDDGAPSVALQEVLLSDAEVAAIPPAGLRRHPVAVRLDELLLRQVPSADVGPAWEGELTGSLDGVPLTANARADQTSAGPRIEAEAVLKGAPVDSEQLVLPPGFESLTARADGRIVYRLDPERAQDRLEVDLTLSALALAGADDTSLVAEQVRVERLVLDLRAAEADLGRIQIVAPRIDAALVDGALVYPGLVPALVEAGVETPDAPAAPRSAWKVIGGRIDARDGAITLRRDAHRTRVALPSFSWRDVATGRRGDLHLAARAEAGGALDVSGRLGIDPPYVEATVSITALALPALAALGAPPLELSRGTASGTVELSGDPAAPRVAADLDVTQLHTAPPRPEDAERVLAVDRLQTRLTVAPGPGGAIEIASLDLSYPYAMVQREATGIFPLDAFAAHGAGAAGTEADAAEAPAAGGHTSAPAPARTIRIAVLRIDGGRIDFVDRTTTPPYWMGLASAMGSVSDLRVAPLELDRLELSGRQDELHPVRATVQRLGDSRWQGQATLEGISLPTLNPYLAPVIGYEAQTGSLTLNLTATLEDRRLVATSDVSLDAVGLRQIGLDVIQRETGVPLTVALSLLKDVGGEIELSIPVQLDTATGHYELGDFVTQAIGRAVVGALSSPLRWLGMLFGTDGPPHALAIDPIPFRAGSGDLDDAGRTRVAQVARILAAHAELDVILKAQIAPADRDAAGDAGLADLAQRRVAAVQSAFVRGRDGAPILASRLVVAPWSPPAGGALDAAPAVYVEVQSR